MLFFSEVDVVYEQELEDFFYINALFIWYFYQKFLPLPRWNKANSYRKNREMKQVQNWVLFLDDFYNNLTISLD